MLRNCEGCFLRPSMNKNGEKSRIPKLILVSKALNYVVRSH